MPRVGNREFAYNAAGIRAAMKAAKNMKRRPGPNVVNGPGMRQPKPPKNWRPPSGGPRPGTMRPRVPYQGPVSLTPRPMPRPIRVTPPAPGSGNPNIPDRGPSRVPTANPNIPGRGPVKNNPLIPDRRQPSGTRRVQRPRPMNIRFPRN